MAKIALPIEADRCYVVSTLAKFDKVIIYFYKNEEVTGMLHYTKKEFKDIRPVLVEKFGKDLKFGKK